MDNKKLRYICAGLLAHVDAGKTTLSEALLYGSGRLRKLGRVDKKDAFLDTDAMERERGITIFSKQALLPLGDNLQVTLLDTPGHVDFSAEMERTLQVLDYAVLLINGADGVQGHTETLWKLLSRYRIPTFLFINKMDQAGTDRAKLLLELETKLSERCIDFTDIKEEYTEQFSEAAAMCDDELLARYLESGTVTEEEIAALISERKLFPCWFGSALKLTGVDDFIAGLARYMIGRSYPDTFGAKVFKIARDAQGNRETWLKVTGGKLSVRMQIGEEKIDRIRIYDGSSFEPVSEAEAGMVCAVQGLSHAVAGMGLGAEPDSEKPVLEPVLSYRLSLPDGSDMQAAYRKLKVLEDEEPELSLTWNEKLSEIHVKLMGEVQTEILKRMIAERFRMDAEFTEGHIVYRETILRPAIGIGHFEPLRHYAEVHLLLEPLPRGSGMEYATALSTDKLPGNWQRLVLTHLMEREHPGVLTGAPITDMRITLVAGRAHEKHTEGGDFRQATYRAVRQGLMEAECALLEPWYEFTIELPAEAAGHAMTDIRRMEGSFEAPENTGDMTVIRGRAPVSEMRSYQRELTAYTRGRGRMTLRFAGYELCHDQEKVLSEIGYDPERDIDNPTGSVFCAHGAGFTVPWNEVPAYAHLESGLTENRTDTDQDPDFTEGTVRQQPARGGNGLSGRTASYDGGYAADAELEEIFRRTFGTSKRDEARHKGLLDRASGSGTDGGKGKRSGGNGDIFSADPAENWLLVDGYNIIHAWDELKELAALNFDAARERLLDILSNYQGFKHCRVLVVFDAYKVPGRVNAEVEQWNNIYVIYTKQAETADQYIAKAVQQINGRYNVTVATSDRLVQLIILGQGALRLSARELYEEVEAVNAQIRRDYTERRTKTENYVLKPDTDSTTEGKKE
ncbi:MAG: TetM/TetW/TetO/TetS family tetracycline resistance ribosomal protection protein [Eubacteriales bacterium]|nr:TetM/TetW/TetO/TetS family tetracycline resistance ribosomal protection protein [Eubacteriales bacterium]